MWIDILRLVQSEYLKTLEYIQFLKDHINKPEEYESEAIEAWKKSLAEQNRYLSWIEDVKTSIEYIAK